MEGSSSLSTGSDSSSNQSSKAATGTAGVGSSGASKFLASLPSRGLFSSTVSSSNPGGMRVYICEHDTSPPEDQLIKTNQENILIRSLMLKNQKGDGCSKVLSSRKRAADRALDSRAKRAISNVMQTSQQEGLKSQMPRTDFQNLTVERLRAILKEKGLSQKGRKDELISRLKAAAENKPL